MSIDLKDTYLFATLDENQLRRVERISQAVQLREGEHLFSAGDEARRFYLVTQGKMKLYRLSLAGNEKVIEIIRPGHTFAEALMFMEKPTYPVSAAAIGKAKLLAFENQAFLGLLRESVDTCFRLMGDMSLRLRRLIKEIDDLTLQSATGRVAGYLCGQVMFKGIDRVEFDLEAPKGVLASRLSVKPETFSRILHNFSNQGLVRVKGGHIEILNADGLRAQAESAGICGGSLGPGR